MKIRFQRAFFTRCSLHAYPARAFEKRTFIRDGEPEAPDNFVVGGAKQ
jgi:hypothetical protein